MREERVPKISYSVQEGVIFVDYPKDPSKSKKIKPYDL